jgi:sortase A
VELTAEPDLLEQPEGSKGRPSARRSRAARRRREPRPPLGPAAIAFVVGFSLISALALWFVLYAFVLSGFQEASSQHWQYGDLRSELAQEIAPLKADGPLGQPLAILHVPQAGINDVVAAGTTSGVLEDGPGLQPGSALPGQVGTAVIFGKQATFGGPFAHLAVLRPGDLLDVTTGEGTFFYQVTDRRYFGQLAPALPDGQGRLTLVTAVGSGWSGLWSPDQVLYVDARLVSKPASGPGPVQVVIPAAEQVNRGDIAALTPLVLWLQLLVICAIAIPIASSRWGVLQTWLVGGPALFALLWIVSETVFRLLPNLM